MTRAWQLVQRRLERYAGRPVRPDAPWRLVLDGVALPARPGESVAAALLAAGVLAQGVARDGAPRGLFCGMGMCHDCLVTVDGRAGQRACLTEIRDGMRLSRQPARPDIRAGALETLAEPPETVPETAVDVLVVGAGPAGLAAAESARAAGATVLLLDGRPAPGGQYFKQPATAGAKPDRQAREGAALIARARTAGVDILPGGFVWGAERAADGALVAGCLVGGLARRIRPRRLIAATGAYEAAPPLPGWTLPGVMTTGALQTLLRSDGVVPGARILVAGNGPLNLQVAAELLRRGVRPVAIVEAAPPPWRRPREAAALVQAGVPVFWNARVLAARGRDRVERVTIGTGGDAEPRTIAVDAVALGEGFCPSHELPRLLGCRYRPDGFGGLAVEHDPSGVTSQPDILVVGEAGRFSGAAAFQRRLWALSPSPRPASTAPRPTRSCAAAKP